MNEGKVETKEQSGNETPDRVVTCSRCQGPVLTNPGSCRACGEYLTGTESRYVPPQEPGSNVPGLIKWWSIWSVAIFVCSGFSWGVISSLLFALISIFYLVRILRAVYH